MKNRRAFTLFEVLIALVLVVILMASLSSTMGIAWRLKRAAENAVENVRDVQTIGDIIVNDLQCALPPWIDTSGQTGTVGAGGTTAADGSAVGGIVGSSFTNSDGTETTYIEHLVGPFHGEVDSISFYAAGADPNSEIRGDVRWVEFALASGYTEDGNYSLVRRVENNLLRIDWYVDEPTSAGLEEEVLLHRVLELTFQYYDESGNVYDTWYSEEHENTLPYAVVIDLTLAPLGDNTESRVIHRVASIYTAAPPIPTETDTTGSSGSSFGLQF